MRSWVLVLSIVLAGCTVDSESPLDRGRYLGNDFPQPIALTCDREIGLYGMTGSAEPTRVPLGLSAEGANVCFVLDARDNLRIAHFAASMPREAGASASSFELSLYDQNGNLLRAGWDVDFGTNVFASLEYGVAVGQLLPVTMHVQAKSGAAAQTELAASLFEPFE